MTVTLQTSGIGETINALSDLQRKQLPFATSRAVNALAYKIQRDTIDRLLPSKFNLRTDWWRPGRKTGVNYFPSNKRQNPIKAIVNTLAPFMELQETGGIKQPPQGQPYVPVPTRNAQPNKREVIRPNRRFRALIAGESVAITKSGGLRVSRSKSGRRTLHHRGQYWIETLRRKTPSIAVRMNDTRLPIAVMYIGKTNVTIKPRFGFRDNAQRIVDQDFAAVFQKELAAAIATAK